MSVPTANSNNNVWLMKIMCENNVILILLIVIMQ
jgi:hypothetical protein